MKDIVSAFNSEVLRPIVSIFIPGGIATTPGLVALIWTHPYLQTFLAAARGEATAIIVLIALFGGLLCEDFGSHFESWFDRKLNKACTKPGKERVARAHSENWFNYLRIAYRLEPVGHHYLRTLVVRLKFELGCLASFFVAILGIWWLPVSYTLRVEWSLFPFILACLFYIESQWTHELLSDLRTELLKGISEVPSQATAVSVAKGT